MVSLQPLVQEASSLSLDTQPGCLLPNTGPASLSVYTLVLKGAAEGLLLLSQMC
jgi:hypothetical protein